MTALQQTGYRVLSTFPNADPETRSVHTHMYSIGLYVMLKDRKYINPHVVFLSFHMERIFFS